MAKKTVAATKTGGPVTLKPVDRRLVSFRIVGKSPLIQHQWSEKAARMIAEKQAGKKTKNRDVRDPQGEFEEASYKTEDGKYGIKLTAFKGSIISAAHKDLGIEKTLVKKALFIPCEDRGGVIPMDCDEPEMRTDHVRVGQGGADLRYRPEFHRWAVDITCEIDGELLTLETLCVLVNRAGFGVGIGEWRPEKGGEFGRFEIDSTHPITEETL